MTRAATSISRFYVKRIWEIVRSYRSRSGASNLTRSLVLSLRSFIGNINTPSSTLFTSSILHDISKQEVQDYSIHCCSAICNSFIVPALYPSSSFRQNQHARTHPFARGTFRHLGVWSCSAPKRSVRPRPYWGFLRRWNGPSCPSTKRRQQQ